MTYRQKFFRLCNVLSQEGLPSQLADVLAPLEVSYTDAAAKPTYVVSWIKDWWFISLESLGQVKSDENKLFYRDYIVIALIWRGQHRRRGEIDVLLRPGQLVLLSGHGAKSFLSFGEMKCLFLCVPKHELTSLGVNPLEIPHVAQFPIDSGIGAVVSNMILSMETQARKATTRRAVEGALPALAQLIGTLLNSSESLDERECAKDQKYYRICSFIEDNIANHDLCATRVASSCGMSRRQLFRILSENGKRFQELVNAKRLDKACNLLILQPDLSIGEIAIRSGFASASYFSRAFRDTLNTTPTAFRQRQRSFQ